MRGRLFPTDSEWCEWHQEPPLPASVLVRVAADGGGRLVLTGLRIDGVPTAEVLRAIPVGRIEAAVKTYFEHFATKKSRYAKLAHGMYQEALEFLGRSGLPFESRRAPPFCIALGLAAAMGQPANQDVKAKNKWFVDHDEFLQFWERQVKVMLTRLGTVDPDHFLKDLQKEVVIDHEYDEDLPKLLQDASNAIHLVTGRLQ